jgi:excisionase family DNA binding protein
MRKAMRQALHDLVPPAARDAYRSIVRFRAMSVQDPLVPAKVAAKALGLSSSYLLRLARSGRVPSYGTGRGRRFDVGAVRSALENHPTPEQSTSAAGSAQGGTQPRPWSRKTMETSDNPPMRKLTLGPAVW